METYAQGFRTQQREIEVDALPVRGTVPEWLTGTLVRVTPAQFEVGSHSYRHWFDGLAMLHRFGFDAGSVSYANRYLQTPAYRGNNASGSIEYDEFATDPCRSLFQRVVSFFTPPTFGANTNVTVTRLANEYVARTEYPMSVRFDPGTLATLGIDHHEGTDGQITSAHPHVDARRHQTYNYQLQLGRTCAYLLYAMPGGTSPQLLTRLPVEKPAYMHSFGMSDRYLVLTEFPLMLGGSLQFLLGNRPFIENFAWMPDEGTRISIVDKDTGSVVNRCTTDPFFAFHHVNAFERDGELVLDVAAYDDPSIIRRLYLDELTDGGGVSARDSATLRRYRLPLNGGGEITHEVISPVTFELPRFDGRCAGRDYRVVYGASMRAGTSGFLNQLVKIDVTSGQSWPWFEEDTFPGEPVYVPAPRSSGEDDGVVLSVVLDAARGTSFLLVLDARTFEERARAEVPQHIPFGFHGEYFGEVQGASRPGH